LFAPNWQTLWSRPSGSGGAWYQTTAGTWEAVTGNGTTNWSSDRTRIRNNFPFTGHVQTYKFITQSTLTTSSAQPAFEWFGDTTSVLTTPAGVCAEWVASIIGALDTWDAGSTEFIGLRMRSKRGSGAVSLACWWDQNKVVVRDHSVTGAGKILLTIAPDTATYGSTPFVDNYWEFRWSYDYYPSGGGPSAEFGTLAIRRLGTEDWLFANQDAISTDASGITNQNLEFGVFTDTSVSVRVGWKRVALLPGNGGNNSTMANVLMDVSSWNSGYNTVTGSNVDLQMRGKQAINLPVQTTYRQIVTLGGGGLFEADKYTITPEYQNSSSNLFSVPSPSYAWKTSDYMSTSTSPLTTVQQIWDAAYGESGNRFRHNAFAVFGTNARAVRIKYSSSSSGPWVESAALTFGLAHHLSSASPHQADVVATIVSADNSLKIEGVGWNWEDWAGSFLAKFASNDPRFDHYITFQTEPTVDLFESWPYLGDGTHGDTFKVKYNHGDAINQLEFDPPVDWSSIFTTTTSTTLAATLRTDRGMVTFDPVNRRYMMLEWTFDRMQSDNQQGKCGTAIAGFTMPLHVPLDWAFDDGEAPNTTVYRSRGAVSWAYTEGPPQRVWTAQMVGDAGDRQRAALRDVLRTFTAYDEVPLVIALRGGGDPSAAATQNAWQDSSSFMLATVKSGSNMDNAGWAYDTTTGRWYVVGDTGLRFEEEL